MKIRLLAAIATAVVVGAAVAGIVVSTSGSASNALYSYGGWGAGTPAAVGQRESMVGIPLCVRGRSPITLETITPIRVAGAVHFDRMLVRRTPRNESAFYDGTPPGARPVAGFVVPPTPSCNLPHSGIPRYEVVAVAHRTGRGGGEIDGFRVRYRSGGATGQYTIDIAYQLCRMPSC